AWRGDARGRRPARRGSAACRWASTAPSRGRAARARLAPSRGARCEPGRTSLRGCQPSAANLAVAEDDEFLRRQALEADRAAGVQLVSGDADLGAEAVLVAVGEARRGIPHHRAGIDLAQEALGARAVTGDDRVGMLRA